MRLRPLAIIPALAGLLMWSGAANAENRIALVIGNSAYKTITVLPNPANDARIFTQLLKDAQFEVIDAPDLSQLDMRRVIRDFADKVAQKGPDTVALVYYAGHGLQIEGENYLVPVDANIKRESDAAIEAVRLNDLMATLATIKSKTLITILDACRNNPFSDIKLVDRTRACHCRCADRFGGFLFDRTRHGSARRQRAPIRRSPPLWSKSRANPTFRSSRRSRRSGSPCTRPLKASRRRGKARR